MASFFTQLIGTKPEVPNLPQLNLSDEQQKALAANISAIPGAENIATQVDLFNQSQVDRMLENVIPNYKSITGNISRNINDLTAGKIPQDVQEAVQSSAAARALSGGFAGTGAGGNLVARDLGLTSLNLTQQGQQSAQSWMQTANSLYAPGQFNISSMFITPNQQASFDVEERNAQFQQQWMKNQIAAMPAPWASDLKQFVYRALSAYSGTPVQSTQSQYSGVGGGIENTGDTGNFNFGPGNVEGADDGTGEGGGTGSGFLGF